MNKKEPFVSAKIPGALRDRVKIEAVRQGMNLQGALEAALRLWLREMRAEK